MERPELRRIARLVWPYAALWLLIAAGLIGFARHEIAGHRERTLEAGHAEAENLARVMSEHVGQVFQGIDRTLTLFKVAHEQQLAPDALERLGEAMKPIHGTDAERRVNTFDPSGRFVALYTTRRRASWAGSPDMPACSRRPGIWRSSRI